MIRYALWIKSLSFRFSFYAYIHIHNLHIRMNCIFFLEAATFFITRSHIYTFYRNSMIYQFFFEYFLLINKIVIFSNKNKFVIICRNSAQMTVPISQLLFYLTILTSCLNHKVIIFTNNIFLHNF